MGGIETSAQWDALAIHADDNVAVTLRDVAARESIRVRRQGAIERVLARESIPLGHKLALGPLATGAAIRKYGECIGVATAEIAIGAHVHVHNMTSVRARPKA